MDSDWIDVESLPFSNPGNIVIKENFISAENVKKIYEYCKKTTEWGTQSPLGSDSIHTHIQIQNNSPQIHQILQNCVNDVQYEIEYHFGRELEKANPGLRKWHPGERQDLHADGETAGGWPTYNYIVDYGSIMYLNDNYEGGEIFFPKYHMKLKPKPGTLIFFPSNRNYTHGVNEIISGVRYTSAHFWVPTKNKMLVEMAKINEI